MMLGFELIILAQLFDWSCAVCYPKASLEYDFTLPTGLDGIKIYGPGANTQFLKGNFSLKYKRLYQPTTQDCTGWDRIQMEEDRQ